MTLPTFLPCCCCQPAAPSGTWIVAGALAMVLGLLPCGFLWELRWPCWFLAWSWLWQPFCLWALLAPCNVGGYCRSRPGTGGCQGMTRLERSRPVCYLQALSCGFYLKQADAFAGHLSGCTSLLLDTSAVTFKCSGGQLQDGYQCSSVSIPPAPGTLWAAIP